MKIKPGMVVKIKENAEEINEGNFDKRMRNWIGKTVKILDVGSRYSTIYGDDDGFKWSNDSFMEVDGFCISAQINICGGIDAARFMKAIVSMAPDGADISNDVRYSKGGVSVNFSMKKGCDIKREIEDSFARSGKKIKIGKEF
jgi:hypothetical protein